MMLRIVSSFSRSRCKTASTSSSCPATPAIRRRSSLPTRGFRVPLSSSVSTASMYRPLCPGFVAAPVQVIALGLAGSHSSHDRESMQESDWTCCRAPDAAVAIRCLAVTTPAHSRALVAWFHAPRWTELPEGSRGLYLDVLDALAYWTWQAGNEVIGGLAGPLHRSVVTFQFEIVGPASRSTTADEVDEDPYRTVRLRAGATPSVRCRAAPRSG
jgi:hypothetical protein